MFTDGIFAVDWIDAEVQDGQNCGEAATAVEFGLVRSRVKSGSATWAPTDVLWRELVAGMAATLSHTLATVALCCRHRDPWDGARHNRQRAKQHCQKRNADFGPKSHSHKSNPDIP